MDSRPKGVRNGSVNWLDRALGAAYPQIYDERGAVRPGAHSTSKQRAKHRIRAMSAVAAYVEEQGFGEWQDIATAPRGGQRILVLTCGDEMPDPCSDGMIQCLPAVYIAEWDKDGDAWVDKDGNLSYDNADHLEVTGTWTVGTGWLQPNDVSHWMPLPDPPP